MMKYALFGCFLAFVFSCKKPENRRCFKSWGKETVREIPLENFQALDLHEHMEFVLIQDSLNKVVIKAGENMVNFIETSVSDGVLLIKNKNKCRFLRDKKKTIRVEIHFTYLLNIKFAGTERMYSMGTLDLDYFTMTIRDGAGPINLNVNALVVNTDISHGAGDFTISGSALKARFIIKTNGFCDVTGLQVADSLYVGSETSGNMKINANNTNVKGFLKQNGSIYYVGAPLSMDIAVTGTGAVKPL
jgi:Putative auto-transporter adhesin, head GIN domain